ncbi:hypothetical protein BT96DRAFT_941234 [Gymnopus androsaceus JB14]|uniref:Uncharacterized protein n=1 Tax=Gymnopus androsaceus JB14 TaxID=1447944 RepID=A0A6A4HEY9_9AGAR|nr:hypothetical protein BT96DRAFT_941234 [Gymnopus androsaceus JB14]
MSQPSPILLLTVSWPIQDGFNQTKAENVTFLEAVHATIMFAQALNEAKSNNLVNLTMTERECSSYTHGGFGSMLLYSIPRYIHSCEFTEQGEPAMEDEVQDVFPGSAKILLSRPTVDPLSSSSITATIDPSTHCSSTATREGAYVSCATTSMLPYPFG